MLEGYLNFFTRKYSEEHKRRFKMRFYESFTLKRLLPKIVKIVIFLVIEAAIVVRVIRQPEQWWLIPLSLVLFFITHISASTSYATYSTLYMDKTVLIPKKYNKLALFIATLALVGTFYILFKFYGKVNLF